MRLLADINRTVSFPVKVCFLIIGRLLGEINWMAKPRVQENGCEQGEKKQAKMIEFLT